MPELVGAPLSREKPLSIKDPFGETPFPIEFFDQELLKPWAETMPNTLKLFLADILFIEFLNQSGLL